MARILENDSRVYQALCSYANLYGTFPGNQRLAQDAGYESTQSALESLRRLETAGYIEIKTSGHRQINSIILVHSGMHLRPRVTGKGFKNFIRPISRGC